MLRQAADEMLDWRGSGQSVMEMSHRGKDFMSIAAAAEADLRELLGIPDHYHVLFLQGGASLQFEMIPMNLLARPGTADYVNTGEWAKKAIKAARGLADVHVAAELEDRSFTYCRRRRLAALAGAAYVHYTPTRRSAGSSSAGCPDRRRAAGRGHVLQHRLPAGRREPVRADLRRRAEEHRPGRADHRHHSRRPDRAGDPAPPAMLDYATHAKADSMYNTPPTYAIYIAGLVFKRLLATGGLAGAEERNLTKAALLYDYLDGSDFYANPVARPTARG